MLRSTEQSMVALADSEYSSGRRVLLVLPSREQCLSKSLSSLRIDSVSRHGENPPCVKGASLLTRGWFYDFREKSGDFSVG